MRCCINVMTLHRLCMCSLGRSQTRGWWELTGNFGTGVRACFEIYPIHIPGLWKKKQTHSYTRSSLTHLYTALWFFVLIYCWYLHKYCSQFIEYQENKQPRKISERKICTYTWMSEKWGLSYTNEEKLGQSYTFFVECLRSYPRTMSKKLPPVHPPPPSHPRVVKWTGTNLCYVR